MSYVEESPEGLTYMKHKRKQVTDWMIKIGKNKKKGI